MVVNELQSEAGVACSSLQISGAPILSACAGERAVSITLISAAIGSLSAELFYFCFRTQYFVKAVDLTNLRRRKRRRTHTPTASQPATEEAGGNAAPETIDDGLFPTDLLDEQQTTDLAQIGTNPALSSPSNRTDPYSRASGLPDISFNDDPSTIEDDVFLQSADVQNTVLATSSTRSALKFDFVDNEDASDGDEYNPYTAHRSTLLESAPVSFLVVEAITRSLD